jgi:hypothetical protein
MQEQDKEIFQDYEIKNWNLSPRIYKIIGAAAAFHLLTLLVLGQTNLLTTKGCDSPFVSTVCQVLDTVYVGSALFGTDTTFDSRDYVKTELEDADITFVDVSGQTPPLKYQTNSPRCKTPRRATFQISRRQFPVFRQIRQSATKQIC